MSAAKMVADSTQGDTTSDNKKRKKKIKKGVTAKNKVVLPEDEDVDLDLKKDLQPIGFYLKDRPAMIEEMFHSVRGASLQRALPELLKSMPLRELQDLCLEQLEVMSKKRIQRILAGEESANISSSGTDDMDDEEEDVESSDEDLPGFSGGVGISGGVGVLQDNGNSIDSHKQEVDDIGGEGPDLAADSTSSVVNNEDGVPTQNTQTKQDSNGNTHSHSGKDKEDHPPPLPPPVEEVYIKQEPPDPEPEKRQERNYRSRRRSGESSDRSRRSRRSGRSWTGSSSSSGSSYRHRRRRRRRGRRSGSSSSSSSSSRSRSKSGAGSECEKASLIEGGYDDPPEAYTSGSEDGELVRKEVVAVTSLVTVKQEVMSEADDEPTQDVSAEVGKNGGVEEGDCGEGLSVNDIEGDNLLSSCPDTSRVVGGGGSKDGEDNDADVVGGDENRDIDGFGGVDGNGGGDDDDGVGDDGGVVVGEMTTSDKTGGPPGPSGMMDQMELLELEMRARAIKAMLMTSSQGDDGAADKKATEGV